MPGASRWMKWKGWTTVYLEAGNLSLPLRFHHEALPDSESLRRIWREIRTEVEGGTEGPTAS